MTDRYEVVAVCANEVVNDVFCRSGGHCFFISVVVALVITISVISIDFVFGSPFNGMLKFPPKAETSKQITQ